MVLPPRWDNAHVARVHRTPKDPSMSIYRHQTHPLALFLHSRSSSKPSITDTSIRGCSFYDKHLGNPSKVYWKRTGIPTMHPFQAWRVPYSYAVHQHHNSRLTTALSVHHLQITIQTRHKRSTGVRPIE
ncbi:hypothetical protein CY34DRAFT_456903 [Suillus luteus UH-Slu-Lm8-n1]|uniref:Uncharacterized protein n=1 Tax=Suillus luteus UH-Slu-Lm8-n1 TaxID=930992 RepID=A0A0D0B8G0_9AGAM|nr:hypothetical protein CY34DRAFT_456903 [Suillus luteus UH-Slu-Lm8-n1]